MGRVQGVESLRYQYSQFCDLYRAWAKKLDLVLRQPHRAGERLFVDYAGQTVPVVDAKTGDTSGASIFVAVMGASNYTYADGSLKQNLESWITSHIIPQTVACYRDTFRLLLKFLQKRFHIEPSALRVTDLDAPTVLSFLDYLEQERKNSVRSRNLRLAAVRSFFRLVALREPSHVDLAARILAIPVKRAERKLVGYLTRLEVEAILAAPDLSKWQGRRDYALLLTLYNSGARVSELIRLETSDVRFGSSNFLSIFGKGRKQRTVPLWNKTARVLRKWFTELQAISTTKAFPNARGSTLSRDGVNYILQLAIQRAAATCPSLSSKRVSPHTLRHSTAMHLLQSGVDITVIALWLGHESIETTHGYIEADLTMKEKPLEKTTPHPGRRTRFKASDSLLRFLVQL